jgi:hypothetical protein
VVTSSENIAKHDEKPELLPKRKGINIFSAGDVLTADLF